MYLDLPIPSSVAFTGELSLKGNILKVGGVKEKIIGAINSGITTIYIPKDNLTDLEEIPKKIMKDIDIIGVQTYSEIYKDVFKY
jgi:ATP-dependent Lon protease